MVKILLAIGKFLLFIAGTIVVLNLAQWGVITALHIVPQKGWTSRDFFLSESVGVLVVLAVTFLVARIERKSTADYFFPLRAAFGKRWWMGMLWGAVAPLAVFGLVVASGAASVDGLALHGTALVRAAAVWLVIMILLGFFEELLFRGYPLAALARGIGFWPAAIATSVVFGALHYFTKPMENWVDATTVGLLGLFVCFTILRTGDLWFAIGFHTAFDYVALNVLGAPNTGNEGKPLADHFVATHFTGPEWLTGGPRGLEASAFMFLVIAALFFLFDRVHWSQGESRDDRPSFHRAGDQADHA